MEDYRRYTVYPSDLDILTAFKLYKDYLDTSKYKGGKTNNEGATFKLTPNQYRTLRANDFDEFLKVLARYQTFLPIETHSSWKKNDQQWFANYIYLDKSGIEVSVKSDDLDIISAIHDKIKDCFQASNPHTEHIDRISKYNLKKSVFLAHRFDDYGKSMSSTLQIFLNRLGFDVKKGSGYEAGDIPDKVANKIRTQDIFILLVTPGDAHWILSEAAFAKGLNKYLIVLCQDGVNFNKGIIGSDYEYLPFPEEMIEKISSDLLYALPI